MDRNSFNFMKEGFDWQSEQSKDMTEIRNDAIYEEERERRAGITAWTELEVKEHLKELKDSLNNYKDNSHGVVGQWQDYEDRHDSDEEELKRESKELRDYNDFFDMEDR